MVDLWKFSTLSLFHFLRTVFYNASAPSVKSSILRLSMIVELTPKKYS